jgi:hypothetical protein
MDTFQRKALDDLMAEQSNPTVSSPSTFLKLPQFSSSVDELNPYTSSTNTYSASSNIHSSPANSYASPSTTNVAVSVYSTLMHSDLFNHPLRPI